MSDTLSHFDKRVRKISRRNRRLARGSRKYIDAVGIVRERPAARMSAIPFKGLFLTAFSFFAFKGFLLAAQGPERYDDRLQILQDGIAFERAGAWMMQVDPITQRFAGFFANFV